MSAPPDTQALFEQLFAAAGVDYSLEHAVYRMLLAQEHIDRASYYNTEIKTFAAAIEKYFISGTFAGDRQAFDAVAAVRGTSVDSLTQLLCRLVPEIPIWSLWSCPALSQQEQLVIKMVGLALAAKYHRDAPEELSEEPSLTACVRLCGQLAEEYGTASSQIMKTLGAILDRMSR